MTSPHSDHKRIFALNEVDYRKLFKSTSANSFDALSVAHQVFDITRQIDAKDGVIVSPSAYQYAIENEIRSSAQCAPLSIYVPKEFVAMERALTQALSLIKLHGGEFSLIKDLQDVLVRDKRGLLLELLPPSYLRPTTSKRHIAGNPIRQLNLTSGRLLVDILGILQESRSLKTIGQPGTSLVNSESPIKLMHCRSGAEYGGGLVLTQEYFETIAKCQNLAKVTEHQSEQAQGQSGFVKSYHANDFRRMIDVPGCSFSVIAAGSQVLGYLVSFLDPAYLPVEGTRLLTALEAASKLPEGNIGYAQILQITNQGREYGQILDINFFEILHETIVDQAKSAGVTHLVCEARGYPFPNRIAQRLYQLYGWKDSNVSLCYPLEGNAHDPLSPKHFLGKIFIKEL